VSQHRDTLYGEDSAERDVGRAFRSGTVPVAVYGLGKMGLPLAAVYADVCGSVTGVDIDESVVEAVSRGDCPIDGEPGLPELLEATTETGALVATSDGERAAADSMLHVLIVPTLVRDGSEPDLSMLRAAVQTVGTGFEAGDFVVVESTVPPGTTRDIVEAELASQSGLDSGEFGVAFCPERTASGRALDDIRGTHPKIVGGLDAEATQIASEIYAELSSNRIITVEDATTAECVKVFEGVYRDVNIALANELAQFTDELGIDVLKAIEAANTQPFCDIHTPGVGVGGHCIPYYPYFLLSEFETPGPLMQTARSVNDGMAGFTVRTLTRELAATGTSLEESTVLLLGLTYRPGVAETTKSPAKPLAKQLRRAGARVFGVDPMLSDCTEFAVESCPISEIQTIEADAAVLVTAHPEFQSLPFESLDPMVVVDGRQALALGDSDHRVYTVGGG